MAWTVERTREHVLDSLTTREGVRQDVGDFTRDNIAARLPKDAEEVLDAALDSLVEDGSLSRHQIHTEILVV